MIFDPMFIRKIAAPIRTVRAMRTVCATILLSCLCMISINTAQADGNTAQADGPVPDEDDRDPVWVALWSKDHALSEATFFEELSLVFDLPKVERFDMPEGFNEMTVRQKRAAVLRYSPVAAVALWPGNLDGRPVVYVLSLTEIDTTRETEASAVDATNLPSAALAVKELVSALPKSPVPRPSNPSPAARPAQLQDQESPWDVTSKQVPQSDNFRDDLSVDATLHAQGDFTGTGGGRYTLFGGGLRLTKRPREKTDLRVSISGGAGPHIDSEDIALTGWWLSPVLEAVVSGRIGRVRMGPAFQIIGLFQSIRFKSRIDPSVTETVVNNWNLMGGLGLAFAASLNDACSIGWVAGAAVPVFVYSYALPDYGYKSEVKTPIVSWRFTLSIDIRMPRRKKSKDSPPSGYSRQDKAAAKQ